MKRIYSFLFWTFLSAIGISSQAQSYTKTDLGIKTQINAMDVEIQFYGSSIVRIVKSPEGKPFTKNSLSVVKKPQSVKLSVARQGDVISVKSDKLKVSLDTKSGKIAYTTLAGVPLLSEKESGTTFTGFDDAGSKTYTVSQSFTLDNDEAIYGMGQQQRGKLSLRGEKINMSAEVNANINLQISPGPQGDLREGMNAYFNWMESLAPDFRANAKNIFGMWLPPTAGTLVNLKAGEHQVQVLCKANNTPTLSWKRSDDLTTFRSPVAQAIDYVVFYGPSADNVIATYRNLSGNAPMFPKWAYGFWQCRERYTSGKHLVETIKEFRKRNLPVDVIVQDWQYWGKDSLWNAMNFDHNTYPDPQGMGQEYN